MSCRGSRPCNCTSGQHSDQDIVTFRSEPCTPPEQGTHGVTDGGGIVPLQRLTQASIVGKYESRPGIRTSSGHILPGHRSQRWSRIPPADDPDLYAPYLQPAVSDHTAVSGLRSGRIGRLCHGDAVGQTHRLTPGEHQHMAARLQPSGVARSTQQDPGFAGTLQEITHPATRRRRQRRWGGRNARRVLLGRHPSSLSRGRRWLPPGPLRKVPDEWPPPRRTRPHRRRPRQPLPRRHP